MSEPDGSEDASADKSADDADDARSGRGALGRVTAHVLALEAGDHAW